MNSLDKYTSSYTKDFRVCPPPEGTYCAWTDKASPFKPVPGARTLWRKAKGASPSRRSAVPTDRLGAGRESVRAKGPQRMLRPL